MTTTYSTTSLPNWNNFSTTIRELPKEISKPANITLALTTARCARFTEGFIKSWQGIPISKFALHKLKLLVLGGAILLTQDIIRIAKNSLHLPRREKIEAALSIIGNLGSIGLCTRIFTEGLASIGAISAKIIPKTNPLVAVSGAFETVGIGLETKWLTDTFSFSTQFKKHAGLNKSASEYTLKNYQDGLSFINTTKTKVHQFVLKYFYENETELFKKLSGIEKAASTQLQSQDPNEVKAAKNSLHQAMQNLHERVTAKKWSHALKIIASSANLIGTGLLVFTPVAPYIGFGALLTSGLFSLAAIAQRNRTLTRFKSGL